MDNNQDNIMEARLGKAARKVFKRILKNIEGEPVLVVEPGDNEAGSSVSDETIDEILAWLFKRS